MMCSKLADVHLHARTNLNQFKYRMAVVRFRQSTYVGSCAEHDNHDGQLLLPANQLGANQLAENQLAFLAVSKPFTVS